jgi:hypothetical protein
MSKVTGPLLSIGASGTIAKTQVYSKWRGQAYVRQHVIPANPKTADQMAVRNVFRFAQAIWTFMGALAIAPWNLQATGQKYTGRNKYSSLNVPALKGDADCQDIVGSPGAKGGLPPLTLVAAATAVAGELELTFTTPSAPTGWTLTSVVGVAFPDQDPATAFGQLIKEGEDSVAKTTVTLTGLPAALCVATGWTKWSKPDSTVAYGPSLTTTGTPI